MPSPPARRLHSPASILEPFAQPKTSATTLMAAPPRPWFCSTGAACDAVFVPQPSARSRPCLISCPAHARACPRSGPYTIVFYDTNAAVAVRVRSHSFDTVEEAVSVEPGPVGGACSAVPLPALPTTTDLCCQSGPGRGPQRRSSNCLYLTAPAGSRLRFNSRKRATVDGSEPRHPSATRVWLSVPPAASHSTERPRTPTAVPVPLDIPACRRRSTTELR